MTKIPRFVLIFIKIAIVAASTGYIIEKIINREIDFSDLSAACRYENLLLIFLLLFMMALNWSLEAVKWKLVISPVHRVNYLFSLKAVIAGVTSGIFTPLRIGESLGRVFYSGLDSKWLVFAHSLAGSIMQLMATVFFGLAGIFYFNYSDYHLPENLFSRLFIILFISVVVSILMIYFGSEYLQRRRKAIKLMPNGLETRIIFSAFLISCLRYIVFSLQYLICLRIFDVGGSSAELLSMIAFTFLVSTFLPTFALAEVSVRGSVALYFIGPLTSASSGVVAGSLLLWLVNICIPALTGSIMWIRRRMR